MVDSAAQPMDFDAWVEVAVKDPAVFEEMRRAAIEAVIGNASPSSQTRLRRLQWRIDEERRLARTPMGACIRLSNMMWRSVLGPGGLQERVGELQRLLSGEAPRGSAGETSAEIIAFERAQHRAR